MLWARDSDDNKVAAGGRVRGCAYFCPKCGSPVFAVIDSRFMIDHFKHHRGALCSYAGGGQESDAHRGAKEYLTSLLQSRLGSESVRAEYRLHDGQRPDVYFEAPSTGQGVAVEIQISRIPEAEIDDRSASYATKNVASIWLPHGVRQEADRAVVDHSTFEVVLPPLMRAIAGRGASGLAYDVPSKRDKGDVVGIGRRAVERGIRRLPDGTPYMEIGIDLSWHRLDSGIAVPWTNGSGYDEIVWVPDQVGKGEIVRAGVRRQMRRRDRDPFGDDPRCDKVVVPAISSDAGDGPAVPLAWMDGVGWVSVDAGGPGETGELRRDGRAERGQMFDFAPYSVKDRLWMWGYK